MNLVPSEPAIVPETVPLRPRILPALLAAALTPLVAAQLWLTCAGDGRAAILGPIGCSVAAGLFGAGSLLAAVRRQSARLGPARLRALSLLGWGVAAATLAQLARIPSIQAGPAGPDRFWLGAWYLLALTQYPFYAAGLLALVGGDSAESGMARLGRSIWSTLTSSIERIASIDEARRAIDALLVLGSIVALFWIYFWEPIGRSDWVWYRQAVASAYPLAVLGVVAALLVFSVHPERPAHERPSILHLMIGSGCAAVMGALVSSAILLILSTGDPAAAGGPADLLLTITCCLFGYAAWALPSPRAGHGTAGEFASRSPLAYPLAAGTCAYILYWDFWRTAGNGPTTLLFAGALVVLMLRRQVILTYQSLDLAHRLEDLVGDRTSELQAQSALLVEQKTQLESQAESLLRSQAEMERLGSRISAIHAVTVAANSSLDKKAILKDALKVVVAVLPNSWGAAYTLQDGAADLMVSMWEHVSPRLRPSARVTAVPQGLACPLPRGEWSCVQIPVGAHGETLGMLQIGVYDAEPSDDDLTLLEAMGSSIGGALENARLYQVAREMADRDPITGLLNHRALKERLDQELVRARRDEQPLSVIVMDLNNFKLFNDTYGHPIGDDVLRTVGGALREICRGSDTFGRHGGDEFLAILPGCESEGALAIADRVSEHLAAHGFRVAGDDRVIPVSVSSGVAVYPHDGVLRDTLLAFADENMYESKRQGGKAVAATADLRAFRHLREGESFGLLDAMVSAVDNKDSYTRRHSDEVTRYSIWMAEHLGWSEPELRTLRMAGLLHDVGKIGVPDQILHKPQRLTTGEEEKMRQHPILGAMLVSAVPELQDIVPGVKYHHERWDGGGYPSGLAGEEIPLMGRLLAVPDAFSAMTTDRPYRKALPIDAAVENLVRGAGTQFDAAMVDLFRAAVVPRLGRQAEPADEVCEPATKSAAPRSRAAARAAKPAPAAAA